MTTTCSTPNISRKPGKRGPRLPISARPWTNAQRVLRTHRITQQAIADASGVPLNTVNRVLSIIDCGRCQYSSVLRVRAAAERLLRQRAYPLIGELWISYDIGITEGKAA